MSKDRGTLAAVLPVEEGLGGRWGGGWDQNLENLWDHIKEPGFLLQERGTSRQEPGAMLVRAGGEDMLGACGPGF